MSDAQIKLIPVTRLTPLLHQIISDGGEEADRLLGLFAPTCDCNVAIELRSRIISGDTALIAEIRNLIKPLDIPEPAMLTTPL